MLNLDRLLDKIYISLQHNLKFLLPTKKDNLNEEQIFIENLKKSLKQYKDVVKLYTITYLKTNPEFHESKVTIENFSSILLSDVVVLMDGDINKLQNAAVTIIKKYKNTDDAFIVLNKLFQVIIKDDLEKYCGVNGKYVAEHRINNSMSLLSRAKKHINATRIGVVINLEAKLIKIIDEIYITSRKTYRFNSDNATFFEKNIFCFVADNIIYSERDILNYIEHKLDSQIKSYLEPQRQHNVFNITNLIVNIWDDIVNTSNSLYINRQQSNSAPSNQTENSSEYDVAVTNGPNSNDDTKPKMNPSRIEKIRKNSYNCTRKR